MFKWRYEIRSNVVPFKGYTGPQIGLKWTKIGQNRGISDILGPDDAIKPLNRGISDNLGPKDTIK